eukprot:TRINITY_DN38405_c0_g1_i1.p1 TRINITY_DN38405_c0_g1~~TRINITY_DN38405_c0_g1_i1.p1  ORF type:complete len:217 (-),score=59.43 TRINITY_DN38405_c0_g1_i1:122-676(-)
MLRSLVGSEMCIRDRLKDFGMSIRPEGAPDSPLASKRNLISNALLSMIKGCGGSTSVIVAEREGQFVVVHQKFGVSALHLTVVPVEPIANLSGLTRAHLGVLEAGRGSALQVMRERWPEFDEEQVRVGFVHPQAMEQVQMHLVAPPMHHERLFEAPRWHRFDQVMQELESDGAVTIMNLSLIHI